MRIIAETDSSMSLRSSGTFWCMFTCQCSLKVLDIRAVYHSYSSHVEFMEGDSPFPADNYTLCSRSISNLTADNLPGLGRVLGNAYVSFGRKLETRLGWAAEKLMHRGPREIALRIQTIYSDTTLSSSTRCKRVKKKCKTLDRYVR